MSVDPWKHRSTHMSCLTCMWFLAKRADDQTEHVGRCRKHAPTLNGYPVVFGVDWCGDHKLNEETFNA